MATKAKIVGIYGISGSGKTHLLNQLEGRLQEEDFAFYDGSDQLDCMVPGGLNSFSKFGESEKVLWREKAIESIARECSESSKVGIVAGHAFLCSANGNVEAVYTRKDLDLYTHVLYLATPPGQVQLYREGDAVRKRADLDVTELKRWQDTELTTLRQLCLDNDILFSALTGRYSLLESTIRLLKDIRIHSEEHNLNLATEALDVAILPKKGKLDTILVFDADKTLAAKDTSALFWRQNSQTNYDTLKPIFSSRLGYSYNAFRQATLQYEESTDDAVFERYCVLAAQEVALYPEFVSLLRCAATVSHAAAVVVTSGLRRVWEEVLVHHGLDGKVKVIGGGRLSDGYVVTPTVKAQLVDRLRTTHDLYVWAFGDSPVDLPMLKSADQAIVVVGEEDFRSKTMEKELSLAIEQGLQARQILFPPTTSPLINAIKLPIIQVNSIEAIISRPRQQPGFRLYHATDKPASKLLTTPTRDANFKGPSLREAHRRIGWYLTTEYLSQILGLSEHTITHVNGASTTGHHIQHESRTTIVALMRGGEPMAFGVSDALPGAMFLHAKEPDTVKLEHLRGQETVVLVDSVVNTGKSIFEFVEHIRALDGNIRIVVVAGVVQSGFLGDERLKGLVKTSLVALRVSENKYTGKGGTDTGNRLFGTMSLD